MKPSESPGDTLRSWTAAHADDLGLELIGPHDEGASMDPVWVLSLTGRRMEAMVAVFDGPRLDVSVVRDLDLFVGAVADCTTARLAEVLDEVLAVERGAAIPPWMRPA
jgi:hypothetical protein